MPMHDAENRGQVQIRAFARSIVSPGFCLSPPVGSGLLVCVLLYVLSFTDMDRPAHAALPPRALSVSIQASYRTAVSAKTPLCLCLSCKVSRVKTVSPMLRESRLFCSASPTHGLTHRSSTLLAIWLNWYCASFLFPKSSSKLVVYQDCNRWLGLSKWRDTEIGARAADRGA